MLLYRAMKENIITLRKQDVLLSKFACNFLSD